MLAPRWMFGQSSGMEFGLGEVVAVIGLVPALYGAVMGRRADRRSKKLEHEQQRPVLEFGMLRSVGGGGFELRVAVDHDVDELAVEIVRGWDDRVDELVLAITGKPAPDHVGALASRITVTSPIKAGSATMITVWVSDYTRIDDAGLPVRLRSMTRRGKLIWTDDIATVILPGETPPAQLL